MTPDNIGGLREAFDKSGIVSYFKKRNEQLTKAGEYMQERSDFQIGVPYARLGEKDQTVEWREKAYVEHSDGMVRLKEELTFNNLRCDRRFADLVRRFALPQ